MVPRDGGHEDGCTTWRPPSSRGAAASHCASGSSLTANGIRASERRRAGVSSGAGNRPVDSPRRGSPFARTPAALTTSAAPGS
eukprot:734411-Lingulodinium_polyedra.AAC.1